MLRVAHTRGKTIYLESFERLVGVVLYAAHVELYGPNVLRHGSARRTTVVTNTGAGVGLGSARGTSCRHGLFGCLVLGSVDLESLELGSKELLIWGARGIDGGLGGRLWMGILDSLFKEEGCRVRFCVVVVVVRGKKVWDILSARLDIGLGQLLSRGGDCGGRMVLLLLLELLLLLKSVDNLHREMLNLNAPGAADALDIEAFAQDTDLAPAVPGRWHKDALPVDDVVFQGSLAFLLASDRDAARLNVQKRMDKRLQLAGLLGHGVNQGSAMLKKDGAEEL